MPQINRGGIFAGSTAIPFGQSLGFVLPQARLRFGTKRDHSRAPSGLLWSFFCCLYSGFCVGRITAGPLAPGDFCSYLGRSLRPRHTPTGNTRPVLAWERKGVPLHFAI